MLCWREAHKEFFMVMEEGIATQRRRLWTKNACATSAATNCSPLAVTARSQARRSISLQNVMVVDGVSVTQPLSGHPRNSFDFSALLA